MNNYVMSSDKSKKSLIKYLIYILVLFLPLNGFLLSLLNLESTFFIFWQEIVIISLLFFSVFSFNEFYQNRLSLFIFVYMFYILVHGILFSKYQTMIIMFPIYLIFPLISILLIINKKKIEVRKVVILLTISLSVLVLGGLFQIIMPEIVREFTNNLEQLRFGNSRVNFGVGSSLVYGPIISVFLTILFSYILFGEKKYVKLILLFIIPIALFTLYYSFTRISWIQLVAASIILFIIYLISIQYKRTYTKVFGMLIIFYIIAFSIIFLILKYKDFLSNSLLQRNNDWYNALLVFFEKPFFGSGIGHLTWATRNIRGTDVVAESFILQILAEIGLIGLLFFIFIYLFVVIRLLIIIINNKIKKIWVDYAVFGMLVSIIINLSGSQAVNGNVLNFIFWLLISLGYILTKNRVYAKG